MIEPCDQMVQIRMKAVSILIPRSPPAAVVRVIASELPRPTVHGQHALVIPAAFN